jgi:hypothetical protein
MFVTLFRLQYSRPPEVGGFRLAVPRAGDFEREPVANPNLFGIYSCGLKIIDVQKHIRTAGVVCDKSEATVSLPHFKFSSAHLFPLRLQPEFDQAADGFGAGRFGILFGNPRI